MSRVVELNRRGVLLKQEGRFQEAVACYEHAIRLQPKFAEAHFNLGLLRRDLGQIREAVHCLERTVALRPDVQVAQHELGRLYLEQQQWKDAERIFKQLHDFNSQDSEAAAGLAVAFQEQGALEEAGALYTQILERDPRHAAAWTNLGHIHKSQKRIKEAIACYEAAVAANPELVEAHSNLGNSWLESGDFDAALIEYSIAAQLRPMEARSHIDLGNVLQRLKRFPEAAAAYKQAITMDPQSSDAWLNLSHLQKELGDFREAAKTCSRLSQFYPNDSLHRLRAVAVCPLVFHSVQELEDYRAQLKLTTDSLASVDWDLEFARWTVYAPECPYNLQFLDGNLRDLKKSFAQVFSTSLEGHHFQVHRSTGPRARIGFVVTAGHEVAFLKLLGGVVERLDPQRWELMVLCSELGRARIQSGLRRNDLQIVPFPERFDHIVATVSQAACDLLYYWEVGNDPTNYFLPFLRLAPVQVTSWGIQVTTGIPNVDAYLSSALVETPEADAHYTERLIRASTLLTYQSPVAFPAAGKSRADFGLNREQHLYGCIQNLGKFHPDFDHVLAEILRRDAKGVLVLTGDSNGFATETLRARWQTTIPDVFDQIRILPPLAQPDYLSVLASCDVLLDPLHFGGVTTTYDALALSQPVVTLPTEFHRGRYTAACLKKIGVQDTIARDRADYVNIAVQLATNSDFRHGIREKLRMGSKEAFEDQGAIREHERIFEELLNR